MKATGIVRRVDECVIIGQTEIVGYKPEFSLILSTFQSRKFALIILLIQSQEVHARSASPALDYAAIP